MSSIERKVNLYKLYNKKNCSNTKTISFPDTKPKLIKEKESISDKESEFENQIKKIFDKKKFNLNNQYDQDGVKNFLNEKDECLTKIELNDSILYKKLNVCKKNKNVNNRYKSQQNLKSVDLKKIQIKNNNQKVIDSFLSNKSGDDIDELLQLLK